MLSDTSTELDIVTVMTGSTPEVRATDSVLGSVSTTDSLLFGAGNAVSGYINTSLDQDWYRVNLVAGHIYTFSMRDTDSSSVLDTLLTLRNSAGTSVASNDDGSYTTNSSMSYTATTSGTYYIAASAYVNTTYNTSSTGGYTLSAVEGGSSEVRTTAQIADFLINDYWSYSGSRSHYYAATNTDLTYNVTGLTAPAANLARLAFQTWADVSGLTFTEVTTSGAEIVLDDAVLGQAYGGSSFYTATGVSVNGSVNIGSDWNNGLTTQSSYTFQTYIHEIGHVLGLGHAGVYNTTGNYATQSNYANDSWQATVMSYFNQQTNTYINQSYRYVMTPQMADIYAIQQMYSVGTARAGNSIYGFHANTGAIYDLSGYTSAPAFTIYDSGGIDTFDVSGYSNNQLINLNAGTYSNIGGYTGNIGIYLTSTIENAVGGSGIDTIEGNDANNVLNGGLGDDNLNGGNGNDTLIGGVGDDFLGGGANDDVLMGGAGNDFLSGGAGFDIISFADATAGMSFNFANNYVTVAGLGTDTYSNIEGVIGTAFNDTITGNNQSNYMSGASGNDILVGGEGGSFNANQGAVYRLYLATFDREPDVGGFNNWIGNLSNGVSLETAASGFVNSTEFQNTYGSLNNTQFVTLLYNNVLHRAPDAGGLANWVNNLNAGNSRASVLTGFSQSAEFSGNTYYDTLGFVMNNTNSDQLGQVYRLYQATLGRAPDQGGFENWFGNLNNGASLDSVAAGFVGSQEFQNNYGALNNSQFVTLLYNNVLHRAPDSGGLANWVGNLNNGASRTSVVLGFSQSTEFVGNTNPALQSYISGLTWNDTLVGGAGNDTLYGGFGADTFVFNAADTGIDHVYGVQSIDHFQFSGFGYANRAQATSHLVQVGHDVRFFDTAFSGTEVIFHDTTIANLTQGDFLV